MPAQRPYKLSKRRKFIIALMSVAVLLIVLRLALNPLALHWVNQELSKLSDYDATLDDLDIHLIAGEYQLNGLRVRKRDGHHVKDFLSLPSVHIALDWSALWRGAFVTEIDFYQPRMNFVDADSDRNAQLGTGPDWRARVEALAPLRINALNIREGSMTLYYKHGKEQPKRLATLDPVNMTARNFANVRDSEKDVFGTLEVDATVQGSASARLSAHIDPLVEPVEMNLDAELEKLPLKEINPLLRQYAAVDAEAGAISIYLEFATSEGVITGYVKPLVEDAELFRSGEEGSFFGKSWDALLNLVNKLLENPETDKSGSRIPLRGELGAVDAGLIPAVFSTLRNGFVEALSAGIGAEISLRDAEAEADQVQTAD